MTPDEIEIEIAKADGWEMWEGADGKNVSLAKPRDDSQRDYWLSLGCKPTTREPTTFGTLFLPKYTTSRDAILPVIEKQSWEVRQKIAECLWGLLGIDSDWSEQEAWAKNFKTTAKTYCIALLQGIGKWKE